MAYLQNQREKKKSLI